MNATILDLRRGTKHILEALDHNEKVTLTYRGRKKAVIVPVGEERDKNITVLEHPSFGMWSDRDDMADVAAHVRSLRKGRFS